MLLSPRDLNAGDATQGICTFSPKVDRNRNSVRGLAFCEHLSSRFNFHVYDRLPSEDSKVDPTFDKVNSFLRAHLVGMFDNFHPLSRVPTTNEIWAC